MGLFEAHCGSCENISVSDLVFSFLSVPSVLTTENGADADERGLLRLRSALHLLPAARMVFFFFCRVARDPRWNAATVAERPTHSPHRESKPKTALH